MPTYFVLTGPTAAGKSSLLAKEARQLPLTVLSADSRQVYRHMDIGTAKVDLATQQQLPHCGIDLLTPDQQFSAHEFLKVADMCFQQAEQQNRQVWVCGGTGLYIQALVAGLGLGSAPRPRLRAKIVEILAEREPRQLACELQLELADPDNPVRVARAAELACTQTDAVKRIYLAVGLGIADVAADEGEAESVVSLAALQRWQCGGIAVLDPGREALLSCIAQRTTQMYEAGLVEEVAELRRLGYGECVVVRDGIGYAEASSVLDGELDMAEAIERTAVRTRQYAKRQRTYFRGMDWRFYEPEAAIGWVASALKSR